MFQNLREKIFKNGFCFLWVSLSFFISQKIAALPEDAQKPLQITADTSDFNYKTGVNTYTGNVVVIQGTSHLLADRLITKNNAQHKIAVATAYGEKKLAEYITLPKTGDKPLSAKADVITFYPPTGIAVLTGHVIVTQGENNFHGPIIVYNIKNQVVHVPPSTDGQATIIIEPKQFEKK